MFKTITPVSVEPVTSAEAKLHCKIDTTADDSLVAGWITAAREFAENYASLALAPATIEMALAGFPACERYIDLDMPPVTSITSVKYTDTAGVEQTLDPSYYSLSAYGSARRINLGYLKEWPLTQDIADAVRIRYATGYATAPKAAKQAILELVAHMNEHRSSVTALKLEEVPQGALALLDTIKFWGR